jgi:uncharacterized protein YdaU (DUF1376 family)
MSLPWFPFHIDKYLGDTMTLDTQGHGAYLLLMLHYYRHGQPPRDDDRTLAAIARLPMAQWLDRRPDIEAFFTPTDGFWRHERIEKELLKASSKHASSIARAKAGAAARHAKYSSKPAPSQPQAVKKQKNSRKPAPSQLDAVPEASLVSAHLHLHSLITEREGPPPDEPSAQEDEEETQTPIRPDFWPCDNHLAACRVDGALEEDIQTEVAAFVAIKTAQGAFSADWDASWALWWVRWKAHRDKQARKAPPRLILNSNSYTPTGAELDRACALFATGGKWSTQLGPEPGMGGCRVPPDIMRKHNIDPATGLKDTQAYLRRGN